MLITLNYFNLSGLSLGEINFDPDLDDVRTIFIEFCHFVEKNGTFHASGFGQDRWPVDAGTDLPVLLEQLAIALREIDAHQPFELDFYEQGVQRIVAFSPIEEGYIATCMSYGDWQPNPDVERIELSDIRKCLEAIRDEFVTAVRTVAPFLLQDQLLKFWMEEAFILDA